MKSTKQFTENLKVLITRASGDSSTAEISIDRIYGVHWDNVSGGIHKKNGYYSLFAYIPYQIACNCGISCSGRHRYLNSEAKICIPYKLNQSKDLYKAGYQALLDVAGPKPPSIISGNRPKEAKPCTKCILSLLDVSNTQKLTRGEIRKQLYDKGYKSVTVLNAFRALLKQNKIECIGSAYSKYQIILLKPTTLK